MQHLYFCRHGESEAQVLGVWSGQNDPLLTDKGRTQAKKAGQDIRDRQITIDLIVASPLKRAYETAKVIAESISYPEDKIMVVPLLKERTFGIFDGKANVATFFETHEYKDIDDVEGAESVEQLQARAAEALQFLRTLDADTVLVIGHGAFGRALRRAIENKPFTDEFVPLDIKPVIPNAEAIQFI